MSRRYRNDVCGLIAGLWLWLGRTVVWACVACNISFADEVAGARADSLLARDVNRAMDNQRGLPLDGYSTMVAYLDTGNEDTLKVVSAPAAPEVKDRIEVATNARLPEPAERADNPAPPLATPLASPVEEVVASTLPPTSFVPQDTPADKSFTITLHEGKTYIGNGVVYDGFLIDGKVPGPTIIVDEGDVVEITVVNDGVVPHGASIHAAYTQTSKYLGSINAGETKSMRFRATYPGVFMYHCAPGGHAIPMHVIGGQYGMIVVRPAEVRYQLEKDLGREPDIELYLVQHELYASGKDGVDGIGAYTMFNGRLFRYVEEPILVRPDDYVRIYFLNMGPNLISTFHLVGIVWDYVYWQGHPEARWPGGQTVTAGPSDSWVVEFRIPPVEEGAYTMLSHAVGSASRGAIGLMVAQQEAATPREVLADGPSFDEDELAEMVSNATRIINPFGIGTHPVDAPVIYGSDVDEVVVTMIGNSYWPKVVQIAPGTRVTWINEDVFTYLAGEFSGIHNAAAIASPPGQGFVTPLLAHGESYTHVFTAEGTYNYICTPHPYMEGRVIVAGPGVTADDGWALSWVQVVAVAALVLAVIAVSRKGKGQAKA